MTKQWVIKDELCMSVNGFYVNFFCSYYTVFRNGELHLQKLLN